MKQAEMFETSPGGFKVIPAWVCPACKHLFRRPKNAVDHYRRKHGVSK